MNDVGIESVSLVTYLCFCKLLLPCASKSLKIGLDSSLRLA